MLNVLDVILKKLNGNQGAVMALLTLLLVLMPLWLDYKEKRRDVERRAHGLEIVARHVTRYVRDVLEDFKLELAIAAKNPNVGLNALYEEDVAWLRLFNMNRQLIRENYLKIRNEFSQWESQHWAFHRDVGSSRSLWSWRRDYSRFSIEIDQNVIAAFRSFELLDHQHRSRPESVQWNSNDQAIVTTVNELKRLKNLEIPDPDGLMARD